MDGRGRMESGGKKSGPYYYERGKKEVDRREGREGKGRGRDLPDQCQTASYAPARCCGFFVSIYDIIRHVENNPRQWHSEPETT